MGNSKLRIDLSAGVLDVDGDDAFVRSVYEDFKGGLLKQVAQRKALEAEASTSEKKILEVDPSPAQSPTKTKSKNLKPKAARGVDSEPKFNPDLNLAALPGFYGKFSPKTNYEKVLLFAAFMRDELKKSPCTVDDIYSCYFTLRKQTKIPKAFNQALKDTQSRTGFIKYVASEVSVTTAGENHLTEMERSGEVNEQ